MWSKKEKKKKYHQSSFECAHGSLHTRGAKRIPNWAHAAAFLDQGASMELQHHTLPYLALP